MHLLPSLRQKKRYVVFEILSDKKFSLPEIKATIEESLNRFWGELGKAKAAPRFIEEKFNLETQRFTMKIGHKYVDELKTALALSKSIKNTPIIIRSITTSGILKKASEHLNCK